MNLATAIPESRFTPDMHLLYQLMSDISERCYFAGWMAGNEFRLWAAVVDPADNLEYGRRAISPNEVTELRALSETLGGWIVWGDDEMGLKIDDWGPYFVPMDEWRARYEYATRDVHQQFSSEPGP